jgi:1,4-alpha-glucan branching enzyme
VGEDGAPAVGRRRRGRDAARRSEPAERRHSSWYKDAIVYELHPRTFYDSDGDGIGDFAGLTAKLDYLQELGITAIWLLPFYPSPLRDDGYDIADYTNTAARAARPSAAPSGAGRSSGDTGSAPRFCRRTSRR